MRELLIGGKPIAPDGIYKVTTTDYLMEGNSGLGFLAKISPDQVQSLQTLDRTALQHYVEKHSPVAPKVDDRWRERVGAPMADYLKNWGPLEPAGEGATTP